MLKRSAFLAALCSLLAIGSEYRGTVRFGVVPVPGVTITLSRGETKKTTITDAQGNYVFPDVEDGTWLLRVEMLCFAPVERQVVVAAGAAPAEWSLKLLPPAEIRSAKATILKQDEPAAPAETPDEMIERAEDGFLINGTANNSAMSPFALAPAFGNNRRGPQSLYNGNLGVTVDNSSLDARSFSLTGQDTPKPSYNHLTALLSVGGPVRIPHLVKNGPMVSVNYQWTRNRNAVTQPGLMPTPAERGGDLTGNPAPITDPNNGPFPGNTIPLSRISPQALNLLNLYPLPNFAGSTRYNYQIPVIGATNQDSLQSRFNKMAGRRNQLTGSFALQSTRTSSANLFNFLDTSRLLGINSAVRWRHTFAPHLFVTLGYQFSRQGITFTPYFANRENISGEAGITGNNQDPLNWGPPSMVFSGGTATLSDVQQSLTRNQTHAVSADGFWNRGRHNFSFGGDFKRQQFNLLSQQDPRGTFTFTGAATGSDFADFLLGTPDTSSLAWGNADKYFRTSAYDVYFTDDWRISPGFTLNAGLRWEYGSPLRELYGRLVNLDVAAGFSAVAPVVANDPTGTLTATRYPDSLIHADRSAVQPRVAFSWRPFQASSTVIRAGYGVYYNTSVYLPIATQMAQQSPLSNSLSVSNTAANPLTLANGFVRSPLITPNTFAVDPGFRVGYSQNWQFSVQRDLPGALVMTATYMGVKGTRGVQLFLPNTYPAGAVNPCPTCPTGFAYMTSNGNSSREAGEIQLRRRLHNGFTASIDYTYSKSIDDAALGGRGQATTPVIAQDWTNLSGERGLSPFDQRHLASIQLQYSTGMGIGGGMLVGGWRGALLKEWTFASQITAGSGLPLNPVYLAAVYGTGVTGSIRPDYTGAPLYAAPQGLSLNSAAYAPPAPGHWGNAGRNSITGPGQFTLDASMGRTFRSGDRLNIDLRFDAMNVLNHPTFPSWNTMVTSAQFGLPNASNAMRSVETTLRFRF
jgi:hypothetical protein